MGLHHRLRSIAAPIQVPSLQSDTSCVLLWVREIFIYCNRIKMNSYFLYFVNSKFYSFFRKMKFRSVQHIFVFSKNFFIIKWNYISCKNIVYYNVRN